MIGTFSVKRGSNNLKNTNNFIQQQKTTNYASASKLSPY